MSFLPTGGVIFVDDDPIVRSATVQSLELAGLDVTAFETAREALTSVSNTFNGVIVTDIRMPDIDGLQLFKAVHEVDATIPVILITGHGDVAMAVEAMHQGADDFITKPFASGHLVASIRRGLERRRLELDNRALRASLGGAQSSPLLGESHAIIRLREAISRVSDVDVDVLVEGETGVGKELVAIMLHRESQRRHHAFVNANCSGISAGRLLGECDPYGRKGKPGLIETANRGTLFLDEVDRMPSQVQPLALRALEERQVLAVGGAETLPVDVRVIVSSRRDLQSLVDAGEFREDFFYAINVVRLRIPPLRERRSDIPLLFAHFLEEAARRLRREPISLTDRIRKHLIEHDWPGNVRELRSFAFQVQANLGDEPAFASSTDQSSLPTRVERFEASAIRSVLEECHGNAGEAMRRLQIPRKTFYDKLNRHKIDINRYRS